jgi:fatty acid desaturase
MAWAYTVSVGIIPERWKVTFKRKSTVHLAAGMVGVAIAAMLLGALLICATSWKLPGWVIVTYGVLILYLAHHVSAAPCWDEPDAESRARSPSRANAGGKERVEERTAEALAKYRI